MSKLTNKGLLMTALICGNVLWGGTAVHAEEIGEYDLDTMVVTATRTAQENIKVPAQVNVITAEDIKKRNVLTITDALKSIPGLYDARVGGMSNTANGIQLRGFGEESVLVLYDGMPMNDGYTAKVAWSAISIDNVERIEVVQGAASSLYGGRAVGGVINIISKDSDKDTAHVYANYGSDDTWKRGVNFTKKLDDKWSLGFGYENRRTDGYDRKPVFLYDSKAKTTHANTELATGANSTIRNDGRPIQIIGTPGKQASKDDNYNFKIKHKFNDKQSLTYKYSHDKFKSFSSDAKTYMRDSSGNLIYKGYIQLPNGKYLDFNESDFTDSINYKKVDIHALSYQDDINNIKFNVGLTNIKDNGYSSGSDLAGEGSGTKRIYPTKAYKVDFQKVWDKEKHTIVTGFDIQKDTMDSYTYKLAKWSDRDSTIGSSTTTFGGTNLVEALFIQDQYKFTDAFNMTVGLRLDRYEKKDGYYKNKRIDEKSYTELSPKLALTYTPDDDTTYYVSYGHSFNQPTLYKLYSESTSIMANPYLKPETSDTLEIGLKKNLSEKAYMVISLYNTKTQDMLAYAQSPDPNKRWYINIDEAKRMGAEFDFKFKHDDKISSYLNVTMQNAKDDNDKRISSIPKRIVNLGLDYNYDKWSAYIEGQYSSDRLDDGYVGGKLYSEDPFFIANAGVSYKFMKNAVVSLAVRNLFDRDYWQWYKAPGRTWNVGVDFTF